VASGIGRLQSFEIREHGRRNLQWMDAAVAAKVERSLQEAPMRTMILLACVAIVACPTTTRATDEYREPDLSRAEEPVPFLLSPASRPHTARILPPAPAPRTWRHEADRRVFRETRALQGTPRWTLATRDVDMAVPAMLGNFSCAAGVALTPVKTPMLAGMLTRDSADAERAIEPVKAAYRHPRPFTLDEGPLCQSRAALASFDYPSGHATWGWTIGLLLAELVPTRSTQILMRARGYAESRVVCGAHNQSAIDAGLMNAASLVAALHGSQGFRVAMEAVRGEFDAATAAAATGPDAAACAAETDALETGY
jgi:acid phosphatase (class A)